MEILSKSWRWRVEVKKYEKIKKKKHNKNNHKTSKYKTAGRNEKKTTATAVKTWKHSQYFGWSTVHIQYGT